MSNLSKVIFVIAGILAIVSLVFFYKHNNEAGIISMIVAIFTALINIGIHFDKTKKESTSNNEIKVSDNVKKVKIKGVQQKTNSGTNKIEISSGSENVVIENVSQNSK